ncbi:L-lysine 2-3-aminomutase [Penicillium tannophilum]|nr:L-lysine 2-3-aminomutase [Penicillium tannophilum]
MESMEEPSHTEDDAAKKKSYEALLESISRYEDTFDDANNDYVCDECDYVLPRDAKAAFRISHFGRSAAPPTCTPTFFNYTILFFNGHSTYDHRVWRTGLPVRSAVLKPHAG